MGLSTRVTKQAIIDEVRVELLDPNAKFWQDTELGNYVDQWQDRVQDQFEMVWATTTATITASTTSYTLPSNMLRLDAVYWNARRIAQRTPIEMNFRMREWRGASGPTPFVFVQPLGLDTGEFWPTPTLQGTAIFEYPKILTFGSFGATSELPAWSNFTASDYVMFRAYLRHGPNQDLNKALRYKKMVSGHFNRFANFKAGYFPEKYLALRPINKYERDILQPDGGIGDVTVPGPIITTGGFKDEVPSGTIDGANLTFGLTKDPSPDISLKLFKDGVLQIQGTHYTLSGTTVTFISPYQPISGQDLFASYQYVP